MNVQEWDVIPRIFAIGLQVGANILIVYYLFTTCYKQQVKFLEGEIDKWTSMK